MKKKLFIYTALALLVCVPAFADCVCGTTGCDACDNTEDYLEDVGKHLKKQSRKLNKHIKKQKKGIKNNSCTGANAEFWSEEAVALDQSGNIVLSYAEIVEDDTFSLTPDQKNKAKTDAATLKENGQKMKDKALSEKENCIQSLQIVETINQATPSSMQKGNQPQAQWVWMDAMEQNGNMLIDVGEFIETNMAK